MPYVTPAAMNFATFSRRSNILLLETTATAAPGVTYQPGIKSIIQVVIKGGTTGSGSVVITGTVGGTAGTSETLTFTANGVKATINYFTAVSSVTTTGFTDEATVPTIKIQSVGSDGSPVFFDTTIISGFPCFIEMAGLLVGAGAGAWPALRAGSHEMGTSTLYIDYQEDYVPIVGDKCTDDLTGDVWLIQDSSIKMGLALPQFYECRMTRYET